MKQVPAAAFAGYSGAGKTTLIQRLIPGLRALGLRVAVVKHDIHGFDIDREGTDSWRCAQAGAEVVILASRNKTALVERRELTFAQAVGMVRDVDLVLVEGYKREPLTQIGVCRRASGKGLPGEPGRYAALVTDAEVESGGIPRFGFDDIPGLTAFIAANMDRFTQVQIQD